MTRSPPAVLAAAFAVLALIRRSRVGRGLPRAQGCAAGLAAHRRVGQSSWLPFDEARLTALLHSDRAELDAWLDDHRSLAQLAARRGHRSARTLAHELVAPRLAHVPRAMRPVLERRAFDVLTQAHLSNHVIFHVFHTPAIAEHAGTIFGVRPATFRHLRDIGISPAAIAARGGRSAAGVRARLATMLEARGRRAVRLDDRPAVPARPAPYGCPGARGAFC